MTDILIFAGQSNMEGSTGEAPDGAVIANCREYRYLTDELVPLCDPVGEAIDPLTPATDGCGTLVPSFCREYAAKTGHSVVAFHTARGGSSLADWHPDKPLYQAAVKKVQAGLAKLGNTEELGHRCLVWLQGESDALDRTSRADYAAGLNALKDRFRQDVGIHRVGVIRIGRFAEFADWNPGTKKEKRRADTLIRLAQEDLCRKNPDFVMLTRVCKRLSVTKKYLNPKEFGPHYNNAGMEIIGRKAGRALAHFLERKLPLS